MVLSNLPQPEEVAPKHLDPKLEKKRDFRHQGKKGKDYDFLRPEVKMEDNGHSNFRVVTRRKPLSERNLSLPIGYFKAGCFISR
jgi:hypothetical protein